MPLTEPQYAPGGPRSPTRRLVHLRGSAVCVVAITALAAAGCGFSATSRSTRTSATVATARAASAAAASCLPATVNHSAKLSGVAVDVSPEPGTDTADPQTQISFLGAPAKEIHDISVTGASSGSHAGRLEGYSQGDGASFLPDKPFTAGEQVLVRALIGSGSSGKRVAFSFGIDSPQSTAKVGPFSNPTAAPTDYQTFYTLPGAQAPTLTVTTADGDPAAGDIFTTNGPGPGRYGELIYSPQGRLVWFHQLSGGLTADDLSVQTYEGQRDLTFWQGKVLSWGFGQGEDIVMNSHYQTVATIKGGNGLQADLHDFQIAPDGVAYITAYNPIHCDLASAGGSSDGVILDATMEEIDIKTGLVRWQWHSLDHVAVSESETSPPKNNFWDWFHINSIDPQPNGDIFVSARSTWAGYQIQGGSGQIIWRLGGLKSSFKMGAGTQTAWQHDGRVLADGNVTFFDDGSDPTIKDPSREVHVGKSVEYESRAVRIALNLKTHTASLVRAYAHSDPPLLSASQGNVQTLADSNIVVGFGGVPDVAEYAASGKLLFDAHLPFDEIFYRAFRYPWSAQPSTPPAVLASLNNTGLETIVRMSWNGATGVASWRVLAGGSPSRLQPQSTTQTTGFESSTILPETFQTTTAGHTKPGYVEVQALSSAGRVLGTSHAVEIESYAASFASAGRSG